MANNNDTGTGGINLDGDLYTFDVAEPDSPEDTAGGKQGAWSPGQVAVDKTIKDLSKPTRETFAKYLSKSTLAKAGMSVDVPVRPNPYPVGLGDATRLQEISLKDSSGNPTRPSLSPNESQFAPEFNQTMGAPPPLFINKGYTINPAGDALGIPVAPDGNSLLRNATRPADPDPTNYIKTAKGLSDSLNTHVSSVLKINRFNPVDDGRNFIPDYLNAISVKAAATEQYDAHASFARPDQMKFGASPGNDDDLKREYGFKRLAQIAPVLQQNATFLNSTQTQETSNENFVGSSASSQGGNLDSGRDLTLPVERINIESIIRNLSTDVVKSEQIVDFGSKFETVLNNLVDRFSNLNNESQIAVASALVSAVFKAHEILEAQIGDSFLPQGKSKRAGAGGGRQGVGTYYGGVTEPANLKDFIRMMNDQTMSTKKLEFLNVRPTSRPFRTAVLRGMKTFFNTDPNSSVSAIMRPTKNTNYTLILARSIVRSSTRMTLLLKEVNESRTLSGDEKVYEAVKTIRESRLMGIFNFFAHIGDMGLDNADDPKPLYNVTLDNIDSGRKISIIDSLPDNNFSAKHGKSRLSQGKVRKLAWSIGQTPDFLLGPAIKDTLLVETLKGARGLILNSQDPTTPTRIQMQHLGEITPRLSTAERAQMEVNFDAEYVPFYFHDVRTNELLGFHAFILSLSEDYSASYESIEGYGRIEPVKVYKGTQRKISLSFITAALDTSDFEILWYKINKLTTFVYPQYTIGKKIGDSGGRFQFVKPFTQQIGASPMIRIRLGNLFRSNYSKFNLAKVFGLNEDDAILMGNDKTGTLAKQNIENEKARKNAETLRNMAIAKGTLDAAIEKRRNIEKTRYDEEYQYIVHSRMSYDVIKLEQIPPVSDSSKGKVADTTKNAVETPTKEAWKTAKDKQGATLSIIGPYRSYGLICRIEGVLIPDDSGGVPVVGQDPQYKSEPYDVSKDYSENINFKVRFEKMTLADWNEEQLRPISTSSDSSLSAPTTDSTGLTKEALKAIEKELLDCQREYDRDRAKNKVPDIKSCKFLVSSTSLVGMTVVSNKLFHEKLNAQTKDIEAAEKSAKLAVEQQAIDDAATLAEYEKRQSELPKDASGFKQQFSQNAKSFMKSNNNSIARSFKSAGGKGLAGFIESLQFDWMTGPWDTDIGRKVPKMCKVTISFSPVHDIAPGLDSNGQNRAPIYPVGPYSDNDNEV